MDDLRLGARVRAIRLRLGWRQSDVAEKAGVSRYTVLRVEHGRLESLPLAVVRNVLRALEIDLDLVPRWRGGDLDRVADEGHALLAGAMAAQLVAAGWMVQAEVSFSVYGERGSIDLLAWHPPTRTLLVIEIKTSLNSVEATLRRQDVKVRLAARIAKERFGWEARATASALVLPDTATSRRRVERHAGVLGRAFTLRGREARAWLRQPEGAPGLLLYLSDVRPRNLRSGIAPRRRVRPARSQSSAANGGPGCTSGGFDRRSSAEGALGAHLGEASRE
jgi:transcriptional regulator with XRE-family HTH domain